MEKLNDLIKKEQIRYRELKNYTRFYDGGGSQSPNRYQELVRSFNDNIVAINKK